MRRTNVPENGAQNSGMFKKCPENVFGVSRTCPKHSGDIFLGYVLDISEPNPGKILCPENRCVSFLGCLAIFNIPIRI